MGILFLWVIFGFMGIVAACVVVVSGQYVKAGIRREFLVIACIGSILLTGIVIRKKILQNPGSEYLLVSLYAAFLGGFVLKINQTDWN